MVPPAPGPVMTATLSALMNVSPTASALDLPHCGRMDSVLLTSSAQVFYDVMFLLKSFRVNFIIWLKLFLLIPPFNIHVSI